MYMIQREISTDNLPKFRRMFGQQSKRAFHLGLTEPSFDIVSKRYDEYSVNDIAGQTYIELQTLTFNPIDVTLGDWKIVAKIKTSNLDVKLPYSAQIINGVYYTFYDEVSETELKKSAFTCDHCTKEFKRSMYFILKNIKTGKYTQIASTCLFEFTKDRKASDIATILNNIDNVINSEFEQSETERRLLWYHTDKILPIAVYVYNKFGWVSVSKSKDTNILSSSDTIRAIIDKEEYPTDYDAVKCNEEAQKILKFHKNRLAEIEKNGTDENTNEFYTQISECITENYIEDKIGGFGMLCYAVKVYYDNEKSVKESEYIGKLNTHVKLACKLVHKKTVHTKRGPSILSIMDSDGDKIKIFSGIGTTAGMAFNKAIIGDVFELEGIVKYYDEYNKVKYTTLSRISIMSQFRPESNVRVIKTVDEIYE